MFGGVSHPRKYYIIYAEINSSLFLVDPVIVSCGLNRKNIFISASPTRGLDVRRYNQHGMLF